MERPSLVSRDGAVPDRSHPMIETRWPAPRSACASFNTLGSWTTSFDTIMRTSIAPGTSGRASPDGALDLRIKGFAARRPGSGDVGCSGELVDDPCDLLRRVTVSEALRPPPGGLE